MIPYPRAERPKLEIIWVYRINMGYYIILSHFERLKITLKE